MRSTEPTDLIAGFLRSIGIPCEPGPIPATTLLPGIHIEAGGILFDRERLLFPGDLLHEAGHIATAPPSARARMQGNLDSTPGDEMAAIAWSFAAGRHLDLDPRIIFHADGYRDGSDSLLRSFATDQPVGAPLLAWYGMTSLASSPHADGAAVFPTMRCWLREVEDPAAFT